MIVFPTDTVSSVHTKGDFANQITDFSYWLCLRIRFGFLTVDEEIECIIFLSCLNGPT